MKNLLLILVLFVVGCASTYFPEKLSPYKVKFGLGSPVSFVITAPTYPEAVRAKNIQGCVLVSYDLKRDSKKDSYFSPIDIKILEFYPSDIFNKTVENFLQSHSYGSSINDSYLDNYSTPIADKKTNYFSDPSGKKRIERKYTNVKDLFSFIITEENGKNVSPVPTECKELNKDVFDRRLVHLDFIAKKNVEAEKAYLDRQKREEELRLAKMEKEKEEKRKAYLIELIQRCENFGFKDADDFPPCIQRETFNDKKLLLLEEQNAQMALALEQSNQRRTQEIARLNQQIKDNQIMNAIIAGLNDTSWQDRRQANEISTLRNEVRLLNSRPVPPPPR